ncbi:MAG: hypothetical protein ABWY02_13875 [Telluria sp.]
MAPPYAPAQPLTLRINGAEHQMMIEPRVSLLDATPGTTCRYQW